MINIEDKLYKFYKASLYIFELHYFDVVATFDVVKYKYIFWISGELLVNW